MRIRKFNESAKIDSEYIKECFIDIIEEYTTTINESLDDYDRTIFRITILKPGDEITPDEYDDNNIDYYIERNNKYIKFFQSIKLAIEKTSIEYDNICYVTDDTSYSYDMKYFILKIYPIGK